MTSRPRAARTTAASAATRATPPATTGGGDLPPIGRQRGADPERMIGHLTRMNAEKDQQLAALNALVDELEEALAAEQETNAGLRTELVAATSGNAATGT